MENYRILSKHYLKPMLIRKGKDLYAAMNGKRVKVDYEKTILTFFLTAMKIKRCASKVISKNFLLKLELFKKIFHVVQSLRKIVIFFFIILIGPSR